MRRKLKTWDNRRDRRVKGRYNGWDKRVTWYEDGIDDIRLEFEDETGIQNKFYKDPDLAQFDWDAFKEERLTVSLITAERASK